jgi:hypothetical protein
MANLIWVLIPGLIILYAFKQTTAGLAIADKQAEAKNVKTVNKKTK